VNPGLRTSRTDRAHRGPCDRARASLRRSESRYRTLFNSIDEGFCVIETLFDDAGRPVDYRFEETNPAFARMTGLEQATGRTVQSA